MATYYSMRVRVPEVLNDRGWSAYDLAQRIEPLGVSVQAVYRLVRADGRVQRLDMRLLAAMCHVLEISPGELLERERVRA